MKADKVFRLSVHLVLFVIILSFCSFGHCDNHFYFVQFTDTHFGYYGVYGNPYDKAAKAVESVNNLDIKIECVVVTGDIFHNINNPDIFDPYVIKRTSSIMGNLKVLVHYVPGNHDIRDNIGILKSQLETSRKAYEDMFGPVSTTAEYNGVVFIIFYIEPLAVKGFQIEKYEPMKWLEEQIRIAGDKPVIIFTHLPPIDELLDETFANSGWTADGSLDQWKSFLSKHKNIKGIITGHLHKAEFGYTCGVPVFAGESLSRSFIVETAYRIYKYDDGEISCYTQCIK